MKYNKAHKIFRFFHLTLMILDLYIIIINFYQKDCILTFNLIINYLQYQPQFLITTSFDIIV